jgi:hypothetical protein
MAALITIALSVLAGLAIEQKFGSVKSEEWGKKLNELAPLIALFVFLRMGLVEVAESTLRTRSNPTLLGQNIASKVVMPILLTTIAASMLGTGGIQTWGMPMVAYLSIAVFTPLFVTTWHRVRPESRRYDKLFRARWANSMIRLVIACILTLAASWLISFPLGDPKALVVPYTAYALIAPPLAAAALWARAAPKTASYWIFMILAGVVAGFVCKQVSHSGWPGYLFGVAFFIAHAAILALPKSSRSTAGRTYMLAVTGLAMAIWSRVLVVIPHGSPMSTSAASELAFILCSVALPHLIGCALMNSRALRMKGRALLLAVKRIARIT